MPHRFLELNKKIIKSCKFFKHEQIISNSQILKTTSLLKNSSKSLQSQLIPKRPKQYLFCTSGHTGSQIHSNQLPVLY